MGSPETFDRRRLSSVDRRTLEGEMMRYDKLLQQLQTLREKYESNVRSLLHTQVALDAEIKRAILRKPAHVHWTHTPKGRAILAKRRKAKGRAPAKA